MAFKQEIMDRIAKLLTEQCSKVPLYTKTDRKGQVNVRKACDKRLFGLPSFGTITAICEGRSARDGSLTQFAKIVKVSEQYILEGVEEESPLSKLNQAMQILRTIIRAKKDPPDSVRTSSKRSSSQIQVSELTLAMIVESLQLAVKEDVLVFYETRSHELEAKLSSCFAGVEFVVTTNDEPRSACQLAAMGLFEWLKRAHESSAADGEIGIAVGSGGTVLRSFQMFARELPTLALNSRENLSRLHFYPISASVDTSHNFDDIPSVFIQQCLQDNGLKFLMGNVASTPHLGYRNKGSKWLREHIHCAITSVARWNDPHSMLKTHMGKLPTDKQLCNVVGEVQFRPFTTTRFSEKTEQRLPDVLMELPEMVKLQTQCPFFMVAPMCPRCYDEGRNATKTEALMPLLRNPGMRMFNRLFVDNSTAREIIREAHAAARKLR